MPPILHLTLALLLAFTALVTAQNVPIDLECAQGVQIIAVVGTNVTNGTQSYGKTITFVEDVEAAIPNSVSFSLNYNRFPGNQSAAVTFIPEIEEGTPWLLEAIQNYTAACPDTPIVLHGYSEGAVVVMNLLCGASSGSFPVTSPLNSSYADQIISVILYGDETRTANQSYNLGDCNVSAPHLPRRNPAGCDAFAPVIQSYCFSDDVDCCGSANASAPWPYGIPPHYLYPNYFDTNATDWVVSHYDAYMNLTTSTSTVSSSSLSTTSSTPTTTSTTSSTSFSTTSTTPTSTSSSSISTMSFTNSTSSLSTTSFTNSTSSLSTTTSTTSSSSLNTTTTTTSSTATKTTKSHTTLSTEPSCTPDQCLSSFAAHPSTASHFCSNLAIGSATGTPWPTVCSVSSGYYSRVSSACACLLFPSTVASTVASSITATIITA